MACDNRTKVYLGYEDEYVIDKHRSLLNFTTNKIGGHAVSKETKDTPSGGIIVSAILVPNFFISSIYNY